MISQKMPKYSVIDVIKAEYIPHYTIHLWFSDGAEQILDFEPFLQQSAHPDIRKYLNVELFRQFTIVHGRLDWNDFDLCFPIQDLYEGTLLHKPRQAVIKKKRRVQKPKIGLGTHKHSYQV